MKIKKCVLLLAVLAIMISLVAMQAGAADVIASGEHDFGPITWKLTSDGVLTISGNRSMQNKSEYEWADYADQITRVVVEDGITNVPNGAFSGYSNLESVYIGNTVETIGEGAFNLCGKLSDVTIPASVTAIGDNAFYACTGLKEIKYASGSKLESIGNSVFQGSGLTKVELPSGVEKISNYAYAECEALTEAILPEGVTTIGLNAFQDCNALKVLGLPSTLQQVMYDAFLRCFNIQHLESNASCSTNSIPYQDSLTSAVFGDLTKVIPGNMLSDCINLTDVTISQSVEVIGDRAFSGCNSLQNIVIPDKVTSIASGAFSNTGLTSVVIPDSVTDLGDSAFAGSKNLKTVQLGNNISVINYSTFSNCISLSEINLKNITDIGFEAFESCTALTNIELDSVETIGYYAFHNCTGLKTVAFSETLKTVEHSIFYGCSALTDVALPDSLNELSTDMFTGCTSLVEITIPAGVKALGGRVFSNCTKMETIYFTGDAPVFSEDSFSGLNCMVIYPADNDTWTDEVRKDYGGTIVWSSSHTHDYSSETTAPTCTEQGYTTYTCKECGGVKIDNYVNALGHDYGDPVHISREEGHRSECVRCFDVKTEACSFDNGVIVSEATVLSPGIRKYTCTICGGSYQESVIYRISGSGRCETALAAAEELKEILGVASFDTIIIASGENFADALTGSYLAAQEGAPILLFAKGYEDELAAYVDDNLTDGGKVYILGGTSSVPQTVADALAGYEVERLAGADRFETNLKILAEAGSDGEEVLVCTANNFADSLSASAVGKPIMLVGKSLNDAQKEYLSGKSVFSIIGGVNSVSEEIATELASFGQVNRISGASREETSVAVAEKYFSTSKYLVLAYSRNFPDGLCGGALAYALGAPLILTASGTESAAADYAAEQGITKGIILGGPNSIPDATANLVFSVN